MRLDATAAVGGHVVGKHRIEQQRHVSEQVMEHVRLGNVVDLLGATDPPGHRKTPIGQVLEEIEFRQQAFDADQLPAGGLRQQRVDFLEARNLPGGHAEALLVGDELGAGAALEDFTLAREQRRPGGVILFGVAVPRLLDNGRRIDRHIALVGQLVFDAARLGRHAFNPMDATVDASGFGAQQACKLA